MTPCPHGRASRCHVCETERRIIAVWEAVEDHPGVYLARDGVVCSWTFGPPVREAVDVDWFDSLLARPMRAGHA